jgi:hypothetical protein
MGYRYGFKAEAERLALEQRAELGIGKYGRLSPAALAEHLAIPLRPLSELVATAAPDIAGAVAVLMEDERDAVSALTVMCGSKRVVVYNDAHSPGRVANSIAHELSHGLLLHPGAPALDRLGCRHWDPDIEDEASFLGGALLIPASAAWGLAKRGLSLEAAALEYGCSVELVRWRLNVTGARKLSAG